MAKREFTPLIDVQSVALLESHKDVRVKYCEISDKVYLNKRWVKYNPEIVRRLIKDSLVFAKFTEITDVQIELIDSPLEQKSTTPDLQSLVTLSAKKEGIDIHQEYEIPFRVIREESPMVSKEKSGQYYQGVFQLIEGTPQARAKAEELIEAAHKKGIFMNKKVETPHQCDYFLSNNNFLLQLAKKMQRLFGGTLNHTSTLHTFDHQTSKELHRGTVTLFCFKFGRNQLIEHTGEVYLVEAVQKDAKLRNIITNELTSLDAKQVRPYRVLNSQKVQICQTQPDITAIHPVTFQEEKVISLGDEPIPEKKKNIEVYIIGERLYYTGRAA
jgi:NMD protein affecting ribosome stability and mRNA decay